MSNSSPFHAGEQAVQERLGVRRADASVQKGFRGFLPEQHREFYRHLPFLIASARDSAGRPWASMLCGKPGFVTSPSETSLSVASLPEPEDPLRDGLRAGSDVGFLGIDFATLRRNRANGVVETVSDGGFHCVVRQTFGNCQKYIRRRNWRWVGFPSSVATSSAARLTAAQQAWLGRADTFFIATGYQSSAEASRFGMDASHRGGPPGFVQVADERHLVFPDYVGNNFFNTFGNLQQDPRCGLLFPDFDQGSLLQLTGRAWIDFDASDPARVPPAERFCHFELEQVIERMSALPLRW
jgi:predicted pyridoxine 5'-phosphate oxidase superfamily flavin-nucleotide-binding protein